MARRSLVQRRANQVASLAAPVGGWNARDALGSMAATDAVALVNMFPSPSTVALRGGRTPYATGLPDEVESLFDYAGGSSEKLIAASGTAFYDVTAGGAVGAPVVTGLANAKWEYANVTTTGGNYLYAVNGVDSPRLFDGTTWTAITAVSVPAITGVTTTTLGNVTLFKNRVWFIQNNTLKAWYLPTSSIGGAAQQLDLSSIAQRGGYLVAIGTWTIDAGYGADDNLVFVTSKGEVIAFRGTDPASAATFALIGVWFFGVPVGKRCLVKYGGDLLLICEYGLLPLSQALQSAQIDYTSALSDKIQGAFNSAVGSYGTNFGWQVFVDTHNNALIVNIPVAVGLQQQYVMNTTTKAWCSFTNWAANCWETYNNASYFGGDGVVYHAWDSTYTDGSDNIMTNVLQAFNYFGQRGVEKYFTRARPSLFTNGSPAISIGINVDFRLEDVTTPLSFSPISFATWDVSLWDVGLWGGGLTITNNWQGVTGVGYCGAVNFRSASAGVQIEWAATDVVYQPGYAGI